MRTVSISGSSLNTIDTCHRKAYYEKILGYTGMFKDEHLQKGTLIHFMLQTYYEGKIAGLKFEDCVEKAREEGRAYAMTDEFTLESEEIEFERTIFTKYTNNYRGELWVPLHVEVPFSKVLFTQPDGDEEGITILYEGKVDLVCDPTGRGEELLIVDHKTFSRSGPVSSLSNQFMGYSWAFKTPNVGINKIGMHSGDISDEKRFVRSLASYYSSRIEEWKYWAVYKTLQFIQNNDIGIYPPNFTSCDKYSGCIFRQICTSDPGIREWKLKTQYKKKDHDLYTEAEAEIPSEEP